MTEVAGGQNEANKTFAPELFVNLTLFFNHFSCGYETYRICTIEDEEHFGEVGLRLTPRLRREMRLTTIILCIFAPSNTNNGRLCINNEIQSITYHLSISLRLLEVKMRLTKLLHRNYSLTLPYFSTTLVVVTKLTEYVLSRTRNILVRSD